MGVLFLRHAHKLQNQFDKILLWYYNIPIYFLR